MVHFLKEKTFKDLRGGLYRFDFYLPNYQGKEVIIEMDGEQHFKPIYGRQTFLKGQEHDRQKNSYCLANNIQLYRIPYWEINNIHNFEELLNPNFLVKSKWHNDFLINKH